MTQAADFRFKCLHSLDREVWMMTIEIGISSKICYSCMLLLECGWTQSIIELIGMSRATFAINLEPSFRDTKVISQWLLVKETYMHGL